MIKEEHTETKVKMGQMDVIKILKKENKGLTSKEISKILNASHALVNRALKKLYDYGEVSRIEIKNNVGYNAYEYKIK